MCQDVSRCVIDGCLEGIQFIEIGVQAAKLRIVG
jgi:hypothetical protein